MDIKATYNHVKKAIGGLDFNQLWPGFKAYNFALYDQEKVILNHREIPIDDRFIGNTAIEFEGELIAIWQLNEDLNIDLLVTKMIHEMFHAFQNESKDPRFPNEMQAITQYQYNLEQLNVKLAEHKQIVSLIGDFDKDMFEELLRYRYHRKTHWPYEYAYESQIEVIEGMAQFVELKALKILNKDLYDQSLKRIMTRIVNPTKFFPIRIISYDVGTLLLVLMTENDLKTPYHLDTQKTLLDDYISDDLRHQISLEMDKYMRQAYEADKEMIQKVLNQTLKNQEPIDEGPMVVKALNIYNARYYKGYVMSQYFIIIEEKGLMYGDYLFDFDGKLTNKIYAIKGESIWN